MDTVKDLLSVGGRIEEAIKGEEAVKVRMRTRIKDYRSVLQALQGSATAIVENELERLQGLFSEIEDLHAKHTANPEDGRPARIAIRVTRGTQHKSIGEALDAIDRDVSLQFNAILVKLAAINHNASVERSAQVLRDQMDVKFTMDRSMRQDVAFLRWPVPRLVCVLPAPESGAKPLEEVDRSFEQWSATLQTWCLGRKRKGKGFATRKLRLFFLCPYDRSLAECGPGGQGYEVAELLDWAKKAMPSAKVGLALASSAHRVSVGLTIPEADFEATLGSKVGGDLSTFVEESLNSGIKSVASTAGERVDGARAEGLLQGGGAHGAQQGWPSPVQGFTYEALKEVIKSFEVDGMQGRSPFPSFDAKMRLVDRGGRGAEWAWVRTKNIDQFVSA